MCQGAACTNRLCSCHSPSQGFVCPYSEKVNVSKMVCSCKVHLKKKKTLAAREEKPLQCLCYGGCHGRSSIMRWAGRSPLESRQCALPPAWWMWINGWEAAGVSAKRKGDELYGKTKFVANWSACEIHLKPSSVLLPYNKAWDKLII